MSLRLNIVATYVRKKLARLPQCVRDLAVSWHKNLNITIDEGDTYPYVKDSIGTRTDTVYYGQYLDAASGQINFYRTTGSFDYIDPSNGSLITSVLIPATGLYTVPANGICEININPKTNVVIDGILNFLEFDTNVIFSSVPDVSGNKTISFTLFLQEDPNFGAQPDFHNIINFQDVSASTDHFVLYYADTAIDGRTLVFQPSLTFGQSVFIDYDTYSNQIIDVVVTKTTGVISSVSINGDIVSTSVATSVSNYPNANGYIGSNTSPGNYSTAFIWDVVVSGVFSSSGQPFGNTDSSWDDTIGAITASISGSPNSTYILSDSGDTEPVYTSYYPICERAGNVLHDVLENSVHISVDTPVWSESLYGSDYLNQNGFVTKAESDALSYTWETEVNGVNTSLNDNTLVPLAQWEYVNLLDANIDNVLDSNGDQVTLKSNI